jgi:tetratricopeptide (TPR) repeat protein
MGELYKAAGDYETAMSYYQQARKQALLNDIKWGMEIEIGELFCYMGQYDSAFSYVKKYTDLDQNNPWAAAILGETHLMKQQYDTALKILKQCIYGEQYKRYNNENKGALTRAFLFAGRAYTETKDYPEALKYTKQGLQLSEKDDSRPLLIYGYKSLSTIYYHLGLSDSAYEYLLKYITLNDSVLNRQFIWRLNNYKRVAEDEKKESALLLLQKDNQLKEQKLKQESIIKYFLIGGLFVLILAGIFIFRTITLKRRTEKLQREQLEDKLRVQQLENEKKQAELQQQAAELEMQALRAQMNPHFIFNCLSSINRIILKNETQTASDYLTRFSRLIRMVLINSQKSMITLEDELQTLRLYLDLERLRFKDNFDYRIIFANTIDEGAVLIPPLLLQPFCENAIWHGLMQKDSHGHLTIELSMQDKVLQCVIEDDGIGREAAEALKSKSAEKQKSMGLQITAQRLALLSQSKHVKSFYSIEDRRDGENNISGTRVMLRIYYEEMAEQIV